jgi:hypothetical protein
MDPTDDVRFPCWGQSSGGNPGLGPPLEDLNGQTLEIRRNEELWNDAPSHPHLQRPVDTLQGAERT